MRDGDELKKILLSILLFLTVVENCEFLLFLNSIVKRKNRYKYIVRQLESMKLSVKLCNPFSVLLNHVVGKSEPALWRKKWSRMTVKKKERNHQKVQLSFLQVSSYRLVSFFPFSSHIFPKIRRRCSIFKWGTLWKVKIVLAYIRKGITKQWTHPHSSPPTPPTQNIVWPTPTHPK